MYCEPWGQLNIRGILKSKKTKQKQIRETI